MSGVLNLLEFFLLFPRSFVFQRLDLGDLGPRDFGFSLPEFTGSLDTS